MMGAASIETTLELWASSLRDVEARMRGLFTQERVAASANLFLGGLLGDERRKQLGCALRRLAILVRGDSKPSWVVEGALRRACKGHVLGVKSDHHFGAWSGKPFVAGTALEIARDLDPAAWQRLSAGDGTKGARLHDWAYCELADLDADEYSDTQTGLWTRGLLIRRNIRNSDLAFFTTWCAAGTGIQTLVSVEGHRWAIEDSFETAKNELGLDHNETRSWHGWHRHVSLVMLAFAMMAVIRYRDLAGARWATIVPAGTVL
ncbi:FOG: Transposase [Agrobacterium sp. DSM 25558]|nr:FOG: Transposase [Agrobacterium sp. DSM 25558]